MIVATPGRFIDHMEKRNASLESLEILVLDEADRMLDMGFAPQISRIVQGISPYRQTLLFSATMPPEVEALARKYLRRPVVVQVGRRSAAASTVRHAVYPVPRSRKNDLLVELLRKPEMDSVLVFTRTKHGADHVVRDLNAAGVEATAMHADKSQAQRTQAIERFKLGEIRVLVATDIAQRGLDISGISHVINYDVPATGRRLRASHRAHGTRRIDRGRVHLHGPRRDRDGAHHRARARQADRADFDAWLRFRYGRRTDLTSRRTTIRVSRRAILIAQRPAGLAGQRVSTPVAHRFTRPARDTVTVSAAMPRATIRRVFAAPYPRPVG